jgi:tRNA threonylcarbamoyladenosine biosynthesis protein TsaB
MLLDLANSSLRRLDGLRLLSICTSTARASVFASRFDQFGRLMPGSLVFQESGRECASMIFRLIDDALLKASLGDFDILCFDRGPGAFTGVRIGCGVAQGLGFGKSVPVIGVNALAAQALQLMKESGETAGSKLPICAIAIDARMGEVYCAAYRFSQADGGDQDIVLEPTVCSAGRASLLFEKICNDFPSEGVVFGGNGFSVEGVHQDLSLWAKAGVGSQLLNLSIAPSFDLNAEQIARLAVADITLEVRAHCLEETCTEALKLAFPASSAVPEYVRNSVALDKVQQAQLRLERSR